MKRTYGLTMLVFFQLFALLMVQVNTVAPRIAHLYPALAAGDFSACRCSSGCTCSSASRMGGSCCCKQAKKLKLKIHCPVGTSKKGELSLRSCPCEKYSGISPASSGQPVFLGFMADGPLPLFQEHTLGVSEIVLPRSTIPEPPIPPPRLQHAGAHVMAYAGLPATTVRASRTTL